MDKDSVILKYLQNETEDCKTEIDEISNQNNENEAQLKVLDEQIENIMQQLKLKHNPHWEKISVEDKKTDDFQLNTQLSYDELFALARGALGERGLSIDDLDYHDLVSEDELKKIQHDLNRPLDRKTKWTKNDFVAVFIAASIGSLVDFILSDRENKLTGKGSDFSDWLDKFHQHDSGGPIDYQDEGFGGGFHRGLSKGHDIMRFVEAIIMFKNGQFEGVRYVDKIGHKVVSTVNQYGNPYEQLSWIEAIVKYVQHMFADLFSTCSLPFPGSSFLVECNNREVRKFAAIMYHQGFNMKNIMIQSLSTIIIEVIIRVYFGIDEIKDYRNNIDIDEDYSNFESLRRFIKPGNKEKLYEMLLLTHTIVSAINIGKVVITKKPWEINVTEIISVIRYAIPVINAAIDRHSGYAILLRNTDEIADRWTQLQRECSIDELEMDFIEDTLHI